MDFKTETRLIRDIYFKIDEIKDINERAKFCTKYHIDFMHIYKTWEKGLIKEVGLSLPWHKKFWISKFKRFILNHQ